MCVEGMRQEYSPSFCNKSVKSSGQTLLFLMHLVCSCSHSAPPIELKPKPLHCLKAGIRSRSPLDTGRDIERPVLGSHWSRNQNKEDPQPSTTTIHTEITTDPGVVVPRPRNPAPALGQGSEGKPREGLEVDTLFGCGHINSRALGPSS